MPIGPTVKRAVERPDPAALAELGKYGVATVHEAYGRRGLMHGIKPIVRGLTACGPAITALNHAGDNLMLHVALEQCQPGDVLIVATTAPSMHGMFGELLATSCRARGLAAVIIDAAARDSSELNDMRFPVWARGVSAAGTTKFALGWVNIPVSCAGTVVAPGDAVVADDDGVVVVAREHVSDVLAAAHQRTAHETEVRTRLAAGELSLDTSGMRKVLSDGGVAYID